MDHKILKSTWLDSPLGKMIAISDEEKLYLLEFAERVRLEERIERLKIDMKFNIISGRSLVIDSIEKELESYFLGNLREFKTPIHLMGTSFQRMVWQELMHTPYGKTRSYLSQAEAMGKPTACRAVANANGCNNLAIIIPCHRIVNNNGKLGGYAGGLARKQWLIDMEKQAV